MLRASMLFCVWWDIVPSFELGWEMGRGRKLGGGRSVPTEESVLSSLGRTSHKATVCCATVDQAPSIE